MLSDIDNFKNYVDNNGHLAGDDALRKVGAGPAYRLRKTITGMTQGLWPESVQVRNHDFLKDVVGEFNLLINSSQWL